MIYKDKEYKLCKECKHCTSNLECELTEYVNVVTGDIYISLCSTQRSLSLDDAYNTNTCGKDGKFWEAK